MDKFSTPDLDEALNAYRIACDEARAAVRRQLRQLATGLQVGAVLCQPIVRYASWSDCGHVTSHAIELCWQLLALEMCAPAVTCAPPRGLQLRVIMAIVAVGQPVVIQPSAAAVPQLHPAVSPQRDGAAWCGLTALQYGSLLLLWQLP